MDLVMSDSREPMWLSPVESDISAASWKCVTSIQCTLVSKIQSQMTLINLRGEQSAGRDWRKYQQCWLPHRHFPQELGLHLIHISIILGVPADLHVESFLFMCLASHKSQELSRSWYAFFIFLSPVIQAKQKLRSYLDNQALTRPLNKANFRIMVSEKGLGVFFFFLRFYFG